MHQQADRFDTLVVRANLAGAPRNRRPVSRTLGVLLLGFGVASCATVERPAATPPQPEQDVELQRGTAVYYASKFQGRRTASGARLNQAEMVAAHPSLPFGCVVRVTNPREGRSVDVKIIDRGPSPSGQRRGIVIDVSQGAARELGFLGRGSAVVELEIPKRCRTGPAT
jgi:rare lipoprotein A